MCLQSIELAVAAEKLGAGYFRVHHFARQLGSPLPLLATCGARALRHLQTLRKQCAVFH